MTAKIWSLSIMSADVLEVGWRGAEQVMAAQREILAPRLEALGLALATSIAAFRRRMASYSASLISGSSSVW